MQRESVEMSEIALKAIEGEVSTEAAPAEPELAAAPEPIRTPGRRRSKGEVPEAGSHDDAG